MTNLIYKYFLCFLFFIIFITCHFPAVFANGIDYTNTGGAFLVPKDNVGIGSASPGKALDVKGGVRMTSFALTTSPTSGYILVSDASGNGTWTANVTSHQQIFTTTGSQTFTSPSGTTASTQFKWTLIGGGGGSCVNWTRTGVYHVYTYACASGGHGGEAIFYVTNLAASTGYTVNVGAAGALSATNVTGGAGGSSTVVINGLTVTAGGGGGAPPNGSAGGAGSASNGTLSIGNYLGGTYGNAGASGAAGTQGIVIVEWIM